MDEYDRQTITNLSQTFTAEELARAARAFTGVGYPTYSGRAIATLLVASGYGVTEVREVLRKETS